MPLTSSKRAFDNLTLLEVINDWGFAGLLMVRSELGRARGM